MTRRNLVPNPSFRGGLAGYTPLNGSTLLVSSATAFYGSESLQITKSATNDSGAVLAPISVTEGLPYAASAYARVPITIPETERANLVLKISWYTSLSALVAEESSSVVFLEGTDGWFRLSNVAVAPAGATFAVLSVSQVVGGTSGQVFFLDALLFEQSSYVGGYLDNFSQAEKTKLVNTALSRPVAPLTGLELNADVIINDLVLNTIDEDNVVWLCTGIDNWWGPTAPESPDIPRGVEDGSYDVTGRSTPRYPVLRGVFFPPSEEHLESARNRLIAAINLIRRGAWLRTNEEPTRAAFVRLSGIPNIETINARGRTEFSIGLKAADPIKYEWNDAESDGVSTVTIDGADTVGTVINIGTADVTGLLRVTGPMGSGSTIYNSATDETIVLVEALRGAGAVADVTKSELADNVATLTTSQPHLLLVGDLITVSGLGAPFDSVDGSFVVTSASNIFPYTISYNPYDENAVTITNLVGNPSPQVNATGYSVDSGTGGVSVGARTAGAGVAGDYGYVQTWSTASTVAGEGGVRFGRPDSNDIPVVVGSVLYPSAYATSSIAQRLSVGISFYTSSGSQVGSTVYGPSAQVVAGATTRLSYGARLVPVGATRARIHVSAQPGTGAVVWPVGASLTVDRLSTAQGGYYDGETLDTTSDVYAWSGVPYASPSVNSRTSDLPPTNASGSIKLANSDVLEIDTYDRSVSFNGDFRGHRSRVETLIDWIKFVPGENTISFADDLDHTSIIRKGVNAGRATLTTSTAHFFVPGEQIKVALPESAFLATKQLTGNVVTLKTAEPHGFSLGDKINVTTTENTAVVAKELSSNVVTLTTVTDGSFAVSDSVVVALPTAAVIKSKAVTAGQATLVTPVAHGFSEGDSVTVALPGSTPVTAKALAANQATLTTGIHNFAVGDRITVALPTVASVVNKARNGSTVVLTTSDPHKFSSGDRVNVALPTVATISGTRSISGAPEYRATLTTAAPHGFSAGDRIVVDTGVAGSDGGYNGSKIIESVTATTIKYYHPNEDASSSSTLGATRTITNTTNTEINGSDSRVITTTAGSSEFSFTI